MNGRWVKYKLFYESNSVFGSEYDWSYEYLPSFYPQDHPDKSYWEKTFREYITDSGTYTCQLEEIDANDVPESIFKQNLSDYKNKINRLKKEAMIYENEIRLIKKNEKTDERVTNLDKHREAIEAWIKTYKISKTTIAARVGCSYPTLKKKLIEWGLD